jgi:hypothetical protein
MDVFALYEQEQQNTAHNTSQADALDAAMRQAVDGLMANPQGRLLLRWLLHLCRNFSAEEVGIVPQPAESARLFFTEGRRMVGVRLMQLLQQANPSHLPALLQTKENDAHDLSTL